MQILVNGQLQEVEIEAVVTRCGCGHPETHQGLPCPKPAAIQNLNSVAYWHRNPLKRFAHWIRGL